HNPLRRAAPAALAAGLVALASPPTASAQLGAVGPYGTYMNCGYYGGVGPYGWGPYAYGWAGYTVVGMGPPMPPPGSLPAFRYQVVASHLVQPPTVADLLRQQAMAAAGRDRRR